MKPALNLVRMKVRPDGIGGIFCCNCRVLYGIEFLLDYLPLASAKMKEHDTLTGTESLSNWSFRLNLV